MCICTCILCLCLCPKLCQGHFNFFFRKAFEGSRRLYCGPLMVPLSAVLTRLLLLLTLTVHEKTTCRRLYHDDFTLSGDIQSNSHRRNGPRRLVYCKLKMLMVKFSPRHSNDHTHNFQENTDPLLLFQITPVLSNNIEPKDIQTDD